MWSRFPAAFRPPALACRVILFPPGNWAFLTVGLPGATSARTRTGFPRSALRDTTGVGASSTPGTAVLSRPDAVPGQRLPLPSGQSLSPRAHIPSRGSAITGHQRRFTRFTRPACPSPVTPGWDGGPWAFPCAPHPAVTGDARQGGAGREHAPGTTRPT
jgi:hypothetical protein